MSVITVNDRLHFALMFSFALAAAGGIGWYAWQNIVWKTYTNPCLGIRLTLPSGTPVQTFASSGDENCPSPTSNANGNISQNEIDWSVNAVSIGLPAIETLPSGIDIQLSQLLPINNAPALDTIGLHPDNTTGAVLNQYQANAPTGTTTIVTIHGHQAIIGIVRAPDQQPTNYPNSDVPYCPCTTETALIDDGHGNVLQAVAVWRNIDRHTMQQSKAAISSITFL